MLQEKNLMHFGLLYILEFFSCNEQPLTEEIPHLSCLDFPSAELKVVHTDANKMTVKHKQMNMDRYRQAMSQTCIELKIRIYFSGYMDICSSDHHQPRPAMCSFTQGCKAFFWGFSLLRMRLTWERERKSFLCELQRGFFSKGPITHWHLRHGAVLMHDQHFPRILSSLHFYFWGNLHIRMSQK